MATIIEKRESIVKQINELSLSINGLIDEIANTQTRRRLDKQKTIIMLQLIDLEGIVTWFAKRRSK